MMKHFYAVVAALAAMLMFAACSEPSESPSEVAQKYINAMRNAEYAVMRDSSVGFVQEDCIKRLAELESLPPQRRQEIIELHRLEISDFSVLAEQITNYEAVVTLEFTLADGSKRQGVTYLQKVNGEWKIYNTR